MSKKYFVGLDNGGSVSKAGLFDDNGVEVAVSQAQVDPIMPKPGFVERDADGLYAANVRCIREIIAKAGVDPRQIAAVSVTGFGNGIFLVGNDGTPAYNGIISTDIRAAEFVKRWYNDGTFDSILPKTNQSLWAGQIGPLVAWFHDNQPEVLKKTKHIFSCTDYIRYRLTGEAYGELSNMSAASIMNLAKKDYDTDVLNALGIGAYRSLLPPLCRSTDVCGRITKQAAELTGLREGTPVAGGLVDFAACPIATGVTKPNMMSIVAGTWSINTFIIDAPVVDRDLFMNFLYPEPGYYGVMEGSMTSASNLEWFVRKFMQHEKAELGTRGISVYKACDELVAGIKPEDSSIIFLPFLFGTNVNPDAKACFLGINCAHDKAHLLRAIYEGIVFSTMYHVEKLLKYEKTPITSLRMAGGAANSPFWVQMFADTLQIPVEVSAAKELGAMGAAICAAVATGELATFTAAADKYVSIVESFAPNDNVIDIYHKKYILYKEVIQSTDTIWKKWI